MKNTDNAAGKKETRKKIQEARRKKERLRNLIAYSSIGLVAVVVLALIIFGTRNSASSGALMGEEIPVSSAQHVDSSQDPGPYPSNPPAGGPHFAESFNEKFYEESDLATLPAYPEGYLVHSLEHGYVIFWYNCAASPSVDCDALKESIRNVIAETNGDKLIAFPWAPLDKPLALTSWGRLLKMDEPDEEVMAKFVRSNRYKAPEPDAP